MPRNEIVGQIRDAVAAVTRQHDFLKWLKEEKVEDGLILLNNSFIFRQKLQTTKNDLYLGIPVRTSVGVQANTCRPCRRPGRHDRRRRLQHLSYLLP